MPGCATITQPSAPVPAMIFTGAPLSISVKKFEYGIDDKSTWPDPKIAAMSPLVGAFTNSRVMPYCSVILRAWARKIAMLHKPVPCVALTVKLPANAGRLIPASMAAVAAPPTQQWHRNSRRPNNGACE